ncbi:hypothetical protein GCM10027046_27330 [Uliginosibacterium flavum]|uniref:Uncharacterized protein n=1 Tax=Uliginosibacterium flavum TaxID=1396831 RepID=A0ABV2TJQ9_9RHOO
MKTRIFVTVCALLSCLSLPAAASGMHPCRVQQGVWNCVLHDVSMLRLLANPAEFDGKRVRTVAWLDHADGKDMAFLHREDQQAQLLRHALQLRGMSASECHSGHYVTLEGVFALPDQSRWQPDSRAQDGCLTCQYSAPDSTWLLPVGGSLDVVRCMPRP